MLNDNEAVPVPVDEDATVPMPPLTMVDLVYGTCDDTLHDDHGFRRDVYWNEWS